MNQFNTVRYDIRNNVLFGGTQDTGSSQQVSGAGPLGSGQWENTLGGDGFWQGVDNISDPNITYRYQSANSLNDLNRFGYNNNNVLVDSAPVLFANPMTPNIPYSALTLGEENSFGRNIFAINEVDGRLLMIGPSQFNSLFEDADPAGLAGDTVTRITPMGMVGAVRSLVYGGRAGGVDLPRIAYVGTSAGELFVRGVMGGFTRATVPGSGSILSLVADPDDWQSVYVLRRDSDDATGNQIYFSSDAGATFIDITENLIGTTFNPDGTVANGLTTGINSLALFDPIPGTTDGDEILLAGGRGGVFRRVPALQRPGSPGPWSEYGQSLPNSYISDIQLYGNNRLIAATYGRGAWVLPNVASNIRVDTLIQVVGDDTANLMTMMPDPNVPNNIIVTDGLGQSLSFAADGVFGVSFLGLGGADTVLFTANGQAGGDFTRFTFPTKVDLGGDPGDVFRLDDFNRPGSVQVTVTDTTVGSGDADNLFGSKLGQGATYTGLEFGTLIVDLSPTAAGGHTFLAPASGATSTVLLGSDGNDSFTIGGVTGLDAITNVTIDARSGGADTLVIDDQLSGDGNANVVIGKDTITGMSGPANSGAIALTGIDSLTINGANNAFVENYIVDGVATPLALNTFAGQDSITVARTIASVAVDAGVGNDFIRVGTNLALIAGPVTIDGGADNNRLVVDNSDNPIGANFIVTPNSVVGATPIPIVFTSTSGRFFDPVNNEGILVRGSNFAGDTFRVTPDEEDRQLVLDGNGGNDLFTIDVEDIFGTFEMRGGAGDDTFRVDYGQRGGATSSFMINGGLGNDSASFQGTPNDDELTIMFMNNRTGQNIGIGTPIRFSTTELINFDGTVGRNSLSVIDATTTEAGAQLDSAAGIVYQPRTAFAGDIRFGNPAIGSAVSFNNINGRESTGLVVFGSNGGPASSRDTLTVLGVSDTALGQTGMLAETTAIDGSDNIVVTGNIVSIQNSTLGFLRTVALGMLDSQPTIGALIVRGGEEATGGDTITVTPSARVPIFVFGGAPTGGSKGDTLVVNSSLSRQAETIVGAGGVGRLPIFRFADGSIIGFSGFESADGGAGGVGVPRIYAVGADFGGGPRVRVYNANTGEVIFDQFVYEESFTGGVRVATGDVNGDGVPDLIVGAGIGGGPHIQVFDGTNFQLIANFFAYEESFRGGVYLATADVNGDGNMDIVVGSGDGGGPVVRVFDGVGNVLANFFAFDESFRGGVRVSASDMTGDGIPEIITAAGTGGSPLVRVFDLKTGEMLFQYFSGDPDSRNGLYIAAGDLDGDGSAEIVTGPGSNSASEILVRRGSDGEITRIGVFDIGPIAAPEPLPPVSPTTLNANSQTQQVTEIGGIRVAIGTFDPTTSKPQILTARGIGYPSRIHAYSLDPTAAEVGNFVAFEPSFKGGVFVG